MRLTLTPLCYAGFMVNIIIKMDEKTFSFGFMKVFTFSEVNFVCGGAKII